MSRLTIIRGLPGSGKTTLAKTFGCLHLEADMAHVRGGEYLWVGGRINFAHKWCQKVCCDTLKGGMDVVVSNTFTTHKELTPYLSMPYTELKIIKCVGEYGSIHAVPQEAIERMKARWVDYEGETEHEE